MPSAPFDFGTATAISLTVGSPQTGVGRTLAGMRTELTRALGDRANEYDNADLNRWINDGYFEVAGMLEEPEMQFSATFTTAPGESQYLINAPVTVITAAWAQDDEYTKLAKITDIETWRNIADIPDSADQDLDPTHLFLRLDAHRTLLVLHPVPYRALVITIDGLAQVRPLVADTDCPLLEPALHRAVFDMAKRFAHADLREFDYSGQAQNSAVAIVRARLDRRAAAKRGTVGAVRVIRNRDQLRRRYE